MIDKTRRARGFVLPSPKLSDQTAAPTEFIRVRE